MKSKFLVLPILVGAGLAFLFIKKQEPKTTALVEHEAKTWSAFTEYKRLQMLLDGFAIETVIDIPCIDTDKLKEDLSLKHYIGITSSRDRARALQAQFGSQMRTFLSFDVAIDLLPKADLILCWDELCCYPTNKVRSALLQFKKSGAKFLLMRHYPDVKKNHKNRNGTFQPINWTLTPYNLSEPIIQITETGEHGMEGLCLWNLESL